MVTSVGLCKKCSCLDKGQTQRSHCLEWSILVTIKMSQLPLFPQTPFPLKTHCPLVVIQSIGTPPQNQHNDIVIHSYSKCQTWPSSKLNSISWEYDHSFYASPNQNGIKQKRKSSAKDLARCTPRYKRFTWKIFLSLGSIHRGGIRQTVFPFILSSIL